MKLGVTPKSIAVFFLLLLPAYVAVFYGIEHWRLYQGPWEVRFQSDAAGHPSLLVRQPKRNLVKLEIILQGETIPSTNLSETITFDRPFKPVPFAKVIYEDLTSLPGVVTFDLFDHEVELLPRVLVINHVEIPWQPEMTIELWPTNKPVRLPQPPKGESAEWRRGQLRSREIRHAMRDREPRGRPTSQRQRPT